MLHRESDTTQKGIVGHLGYSPLFGLIWLRAKYGNSEPNECGNKRTVVDSGATLSTGTELSSQL